MNEQTKTQLKDKLESRLATIGQSHLLQFWDELSEQDRAGLATQIAGIDFVQLQQLGQASCQDDHWAKLAAKANVPTAITLADFADPSQSNVARKLGQEALAAGKLGMILVAGGQGSRLGFNHPKGMFPIGPVSGRTLYQMHFEQVLARSRQFGVKIPIYVMTSPPTHDETTQFLIDNNFFGMDREDVMIFCQGIMPAVDQDGKLLLEEKGKIFVSPNGHGGMLSALVENGCLDHAVGRGVEHLFYGQVDNPLVQICDPTLVGFHLNSGSEMTSQVVRKNEPTQKVGNVVEVDGQVQIIEYSDLPEEYARQTNDDGTLKLWAGSIAVHIFSVDFLSRSSQQADSLPFHRASKKVSFVDETGQKVEPDSPNATKYEKFIFDLLPMAKNAIVCEVDPASGFCAVKNAAPAPSETPEHVERAISDLHSGWLKACGIAVAEDLRIEISPLFACDALELSEKIASGVEVTHSRFIQSNDDFDSIDASSTGAEKNLYDTSAIYATIMAGGAGTRFWPASRTANPKQLLNLTGERSMIQSTVDRLQGLCSNDQLLIVTNQSLVDPIAAQLPDLPRESLIGEPAKRDTAPCVGLAAAMVAAKNPNATMVVMPADHVIGPDDVFQEALVHAVTLVDQDPSRIVTFGIKPDYPADMFGYIERTDESIDGAKFASYSVERFREKPDVETAKGFLEAGTFYWNAGIFVWKAKTILDALAKHEPEMFARIQTIAAAIGTPDFESVLQTEFTAIKGTSIDYAVMEHYDNVLVVEAPFQWDDLGNWSAIPRLKGVDESGNTVDGKHLGIDTEDSIIRTEDGHLIVTVGMKDCIVVHTKDATLVANRNDEAAIKRIVEELKDRDWSQYL
jgi:mannose-1-phosphate guanylyltransferase/mannose-6-phosphate isomerase